MDPKQKPIKIAIIGCGKQANIHLQVMLETKLYEIIALCDTNEDNIKTMAGALNKEKTEQLFTTTDYKVCIDHPDVEAILLVTPTNLHIEQVEYAIKAKKHILFEKPMGISIESVDRLIDLAKKNKNVVVYPAYEYRHSYLFDNLMYYIHTDNLKGTKYVEFAEHRNSFFQSWFYDSDKSGGAINDKMIHFFDLLSQFFAPSKPVRIYATGSQHVNKKGAIIEGMFQEKIELKKADAVDNAAIIVEFEDDKRAILTLQMYQTFPIEGLQIFIAGLNGRYVRVYHADTPGYEIETNLNGIFSKQTIADRSDSDSYGAGHPGAKQMFENFFGCVRLGKPQRVTLQSARVAQVLALTAEESVRKGKSIELAPYFGKSKNDSSVTNVFHETKLVDGNESPKHAIRRRFSLTRFFLRSRKKKSYVRLNRQSLAKIVGAIKEKHSLQPFRDVHMVLKLTTPWDMVYVHLADADLKILPTEPVDETAYRIEFTITQKGFESFLDGASLNKLYLSRQFTVIGDMFQARQFRPFVVYLMDEIKKQCILP